MCEHTVGMAIRLNFSRASSIANNTKIGEKSLSVSLIRSNSITCNGTILTEKSITELSNYLLIKVD